MSLYNANFKLPLLKEMKHIKNFNTKICFKIYPSDMKDYATSNNQVNVNNIFLNRLGLSDTFEIEITNVRFRF